MIVVSDTSPLRALDYIGLLHLLHELFDCVLIPPAVRDELELPQSRFVAVEINSYDFVEVRAPKDLACVDQLLLKLDRGESEAIALAIEEHSQLILMDERRGRETALENGIVPLGVLLRAKKRGLIEAIRPAIEQLKNMKFYLSDQLVDNVLRLAGE